MPVVAPKVSMRIKWRPSTDGGVDRVLSSPPRKDPSLCRPPSTTARGVSGRSGWNAVQPEVAELPDSGPVSATARWLWCLSSEEGTAPLMQSSYSAADSL